MTLRPKGLLLDAEAGLSVAAHSVMFGEALVVVSVYLVTANEWLTRSSGLVTALVMLLIGVVIIGAGLSRL